MMRFKKLFLLLSVLVACGWCYCDGDVSMATLKDGDVALRMYNEQLTWGEVKVLMAKSDDRQVKDSKGNYLSEGVRGFMERTVRLAAGLHLALEGKVELSDGERADYLEKMEKALSDGKSGKSLDVFMRQYPPQTKGIFEPCLEDVLKIAKYNELLLAEVKVTDGEVTEYVNQVKASQIAVEQFNQMQQKLLDHALSQKLIDTDESFAAFAAENSEGEEAEKGGYLGEFPRGFVANAIGQETFDVQAGHNSAILISECAYRVMRVLAVRPPEKEGGEEFVKVSQILLARYPEQKVDDMGKVRETILNGKKIKVLKQAMLLEISKSGFACPLFPRGLFKEEL